MTRERRLGDAVAADLARLAGRVRFEVPLARLGTYRIGGPAAAVVEPAGADDVVAVIELARRAGLPWLAIGLGSNLLFDDAGIGGVVLRVSRALTVLEPVAHRSSRWRVGAGVPTPILAKRTAAAGFAGVERLVGVPGAVGGGVFMNAGAHGQEYAHVVRSVDLVDREGRRRELRGTDVPWAYRTSGLEGVVLGVEVELQSDDPVRLTRDVRLHLRRRREGTPFDQPCCGSVFRNPAREETAGIDLPAPVTAGRLIEAVGLKGTRVGGAEVSPLHANYIVNTGGATSADVTALAARVQAEVAERFGVTLQREMKIVTPAGEVT